MEIWIRTIGHDGWTEAADPLDALAAILAHDVAQVLVHASSLAGEWDRVVAAVRAVRALGPADLTLFVASPEPALGRREALDRLAVDQVWTVAPVRDRTGPAPWRPLVKPGQAPEPCPHLRLCRRDGVSLAVCGHHGGRLVLGSPRLQTWCLRDRGTCPERAGADGP